MLGGWALAVVKSSNIIKAEIPLSLRSFQRLQPQLLQRFLEGRWPWELKNQSKLGGKAKNNHRNKSKKLRDSPASFFFFFCFLFLPQSPKWLGGSLWVAGCFLHGLLVFPPIPSPKKASTFPPAMFLLRVTSTPLSFPTRLSQSIGKELIRSSITKLFCVLPLPWKLETKWRAALLSRPPRLTKSPNLPSKRPKRQKQHRGFRKQSEE